MLNFDGFLPSRASLMMDVVFVALFLVLPVLVTGIFVARYGRRYGLHKRIQLVLAGVLLITVVLFETEVRLYGWRPRAEASPYYAAIEEPGALLSFVYQDVLRLDYVPGWVFTALWIHLLFAITTPLVWTYVVVQAWRNFADPPTPNKHSRSHIFWGQIAAAELGLTALTGWVFYWLAFVAS